MANDRLINSTQGESIITGLNTIATKLDALKPISVADNGKVVVDGELVSQTAYPTTVTENDTYDTTNYNSITINVSGGGSSGGDVIFYDYDGSVVASYSAVDFANLSAMPANPTHEGLTGQGWNWSLADAKAYVASYGKLNIGQMYITSDGKTKYYLTISKDSLTTELSLVLDEDTELDVDWGDNSTHTTWTSADGDDSKSHEYASAGRYVIAITVVTGSFLVGECSSAVYKLEIGNHVTGVDGYAFFENVYLQLVTVPNSVTNFGERCFSFCLAMRFITIPNSMTNLSDAFQGADLIAISLPNSVTAIAQEAFYSVHTVNTIIIPNSVTSLDKTFNYCQGLTSITIPDTVATISNDCFGDDFALQEIIFKSSIPPTITSSGSNLSLPTTCIIRVPQGSLSAYTSASNYPDTSEYIYEEY